MGSSQQVDCKAALAYACDMKPSRYAGFKSSHASCTNTAESLDSDVLVFMWRAAVAGHTEALGEDRVLDLRVLRACRRADYNSCCFNWSPSVVLSVSALPTRKMLQVWAETMFGGLAPSLDTKGKESIYIGAVAETCTFVRGRGSWHFYPMTPRFPTRSLWAFADGKTIRLC